MITIKLTKRLLATAVVGIALVIGAVLVASLKGDEKPTITTNPPPVDEEPQDAQVDPTPDDETPPPPPDDVVPDDDDQDDPDDPELPDDDEDGPGDEGKAHGLQNAIQAHIRNMEKFESKGKSCPPGLENSLQLLTEMYAGLLAGEKVHGNANGHDKNT